MPWSQVNNKQYERAVGENETFIKIVGDAALPLNREHWSLNAFAAITPLGALAQEDLARVLRDAWKVMRFHHPTIAAYLVDETRYVYDVPDSEALEKWASETFTVIEDNKTAEEVIASTTTRSSPYATMKYLPRTREVVLFSQHWRSDGVGMFILIDEFLALAAQSPVDASSLPWGEETTRLAPPIEEAANTPVNPSEEDKRIGQQCVASFGHTIGAIGIASRVPVEILPGGTRTTRLYLTEEETKTVIQACKSKKISVTSAVHASIAAANYALAAPEDKNKHYTSTIRFSFRRWLPTPYSGREYASTIFTTGWMFPVSADSSWAERARAYNDEYQKGLNPSFISAHREYAIGLCNLLRSLPAGAPSPTDVDISSMGVIEKYVAREKGTSERGIRIDQVFLGVDMVNRQGYFFLWTFRDQLSLNLVYNEAFYDKETMYSFVETVKESLLRELTS